MEQVKFKKRFLSVEEASEQVYKLRRHGIDAIRRGAVCTAILNSLTTPNWGVLHVFGGDWRMM